MYGVLGTGSAINAEMLAPLVDGIQSNLSVLLPVGLGIMATMLGVKLIPKIIHKFI